MITATINHNFDIFTRIATKCMMAEFSKFTASYGMSHTIGSYMCYHGLISFCYNVSVISLTKSHWIGYNKIYRFLHKYGISYIL